jgi:3alpha(or 20beta)-hydroxysteroid dehydrogenase
VGALDGKVAVVTGGAGGIGAAIVEAFAAEGASVVVADLDAPAGVSMDVAEPSGWATLVAAVLDRHGRIDVLVNNAGIVHHAALEDTELDDFERVMRVNHTGTFLGIKSVAPVMRARGGGSIVNVSSVRGLSGANGLGAYVSSKFAVRGLTKVAALELGRHGIRVNSIHPGAVATAGMLGAAIDDLDAVDAHFTAQPIPRIGRPADIAGMAVFLASDASAYCTGAEFVVDGGVSAGVRRPNAPGY